MMMSAASAVLMLTLTVAFAASFVMVSATSAFVVMASATAFTVAASTSALVAVHAVYVVLKLLVAHLN